MLTAIQSGENMWTVAATQGELHVYTRDGEEWIELVLEGENTVPDEQSFVLSAFQEQFEGEHFETEEDDEERSSKTTRGGNGRSKSGTRSRR